jgi:uncharacterized ubiquitin-like protein YukD
MDKIIITLYIGASENAMDLEVPNNVPSRNLSEVIVKSFQLTPRKYAFRIKESKKVIRRDKSLAEAGVWDGEILELLPIK